MIAVEIPATVSAAAAEEGTRASTTPAGPAVESVTAGGDAEASDGEARDSEAPDSSVRAVVAPEAPSSVGVPMAVAVGPTRRAIASQGPESLASGATSTPLGLQAFQSSEAVPGSAAASTARPRGARSGLVVGVVLVGAAAFVGLTSLDRAKSWLGTSQTHKPAASEPAALLPSLRARVDAVEVLWWRLRLLPADAAERGELNRQLTVQLTPLLAEVGTRSDADSQWARIDLSRAKGKLTEARHALADVSGAKRPYSLALLDLADQTAQPPWPVIVHQLGSAAAAEKAPFVAHTALIYSLAEAGNWAEAQSEYKEWGSKLDDATRAQQAPLFALLGEYLARQPQAAGAPQEEIVLRPVELRAPATEPGAGERVAAEPTGSAAATEAPAEEAAPKPARLGPKMTALAAQADELWSSGDLSGAAELYRQVAATVGPEHFVGQRAASRVAYYEKTKKPE